MREYRRGGEGTRRALELLGKVDHRGKRAPRLLSVLCTLRGAPPSEIGAENGHCRATSTFLLTNGAREQFVHFSGRIALESIDDSSALLRPVLAHVSE